MKNFKKLFAVAASVMMLASTVPTAILGVAAYDKEMTDAYNFAFENNITTKTSIDGADMFGNLIRSHMAKMMVGYAEEVLNKTPDTSVECNFTDIGNVSDELQGFIVEACQLGLMGVDTDGVPTTTFNPNGTVSRAMFGTILSRALYGDANNGGTPYYADHLAALSDAGIMTDLTNPERALWRGHGMLMMMRAAGGSTPAICDLPENAIVNCPLNLDACPVQCRTNTVAKDGSLTVSSIGVDYTSIPRVGNVIVGSMKLAAAGADVQVNSIKMKLQGLVTVGDLGDGARVYFEKDGIRISSRTSFNSTDKTAVVSFTTPLVVKTSETIDVVLALTAGGTGTDIQLASTDIGSTAETIDGNFLSPSLRISSYSVAAVGLDHTSDYSASKTVRVDDAALVTLGGLQITKTSNRAIISNSVTLNNSGNGSLDYLSDVALYRDAVKVSTKTTFGNRTISFILDNEIKSTENSVDYVIRGKLKGADRLSDTYSFYVKNESDVVLTEKDTSFRTINSGTPLVAAFGIAGGDLRFNESTISSLTVTPGAKKVQFYTGTIVALQPVRLDTLTGLTVTLPVGYSHLSDILDNLYVQIGSSVISASTLDVSGGKVSFEGEVTINGTVPFVVYGDIKTNYTGGGYLQFTDAITNTSFKEHKYVSDDSTALAIWSIGGRRATIATSSLSLSNIAASANVQKGDRNTEIAKLEFSTNSDIVISLSSFALKVDAVTGFADSQVTLYNEAGTAVSSAVIRTIGVGKTLDSFTMNPVTISKGNPVKFTIKLDQVPNAATAWDILTGYIATGSIVAKDIASTTSVYPLVNTNPTVLTVIGAGIPEVVTQIYTPALVKYGADQVELGKIDLKSTNGNVVMRDAWFKVDGLATDEINQINSLKLLENGVVIATLAKSGDYVYATNVSRTLTSTPKTYSVVGTINTINNSASAITTTPTIKMYGNSYSGGTCTGGYTTFESVYGSNGVVCGTNFGTWSATWTKTMSAAIKVVNEIPTITAVSSYVNGGDLVYKVTLASTKLTQLSGIKLSVSPTNLSGYTAYAATAKVFVAANDSNYDANNYLTGTAINTVAALTNLTTPVNINGSTIVYIIFKGLADLEPTLATADRKARVELTDISYIDIFETGKTANASMFANYKSSIATVTLSSPNTW